MSAWAFFLIVPANVHVEGILSTVGPHGAYMQMSGRNRIEHHRGDIGRLTMRTFAAARRSAASAAGTERRCTP